MPIIKAFPSSNVIRTCGREEQPPEPTFARFFDHVELERIAGEAGTVSCWDYNTALGDTVREKYEGLYYKIVELTGVLMRKGAKGYFWVACSLELASAMHIANRVPLKCGMANPKLGGQHPMSCEGVFYCGLIDERWRIYIDPEMSDNKLLIGCNDRMESHNHYARLTIANFII